MNWRADRESEISFCFLSSLAVQYKHAPAKTCIIFFLYFASRIYMTRAVSQELKVKGPLPSNIGALRCHR